MKNLTRVLVLALVFSMVLGSVAFAGSFTDVKDDAAGAEAIQTLADLGILKGYEDGTFGPDKVITRAEAVAVINRMQGLEQAAKGAAGATAYTDVKADHWATGDINLATQMGVIAGDGDGLFRPEDQVKYEEIVKMVVSALGYGPSVDDKGGWPTGYLVIAAERDITKGLSNSAGDPASREIVARVVFNALDAPMMEQVGFGKDATYQVMDGKGGTAKKIILTEKLKTYKLKGVVTANDVTSIEGKNSPFSATDEKKVRFEVTDNYGIDTFYIHGSIVNNTVVKGIYDFLTGDSTADQNLGYSSILYVRENDDNDYVVLSNSLEKGRNTIETIEDTNNIQPIQKVDDNGKNTVKYPSVIGNSTSADMKLSWYDPDASTTSSTDYDLSDDAIIIYNGKYLGKAQALSVPDGESVVQYAPKQGTVTLLDNDRDDKYDYLFVKNYTTDIVDEVVKSNSKLNVKFGRSIDLNTDNNKDLKYTITLDGKAAELTDLQEWDVISVAKDADSTSIEIVASRNVLSGTFNYYNEDGEDPADWTYVIDDKKYEVSNVEDFSDSKISALDSGNQANFYMDAFGKIAYCEITATSAKNYGFLVATGSGNSNFGDDFSVRMLTTDGETSDLTLSDNITVTKNVEENGDIRPISGSVTAKALMYGTGGDKDNPVDTVKINDKGVTVTSLYKLAKSGVIQLKDNETAPSKEQVADYAQRIVTYASSGGKLTGITFFEGNTSLLNDNYFTNNGNKGDLSYSEKNKIFGSNIGVTSDTLVFYLPINQTVDKGDFDVRTISTLKDNIQYKNLYVYSMDSDENVGAILVTQTLAQASQSSNIAIVKSIAERKKDSTGESIKRIEFYQDGELKTLDTTPDLVTSVPAMKNGEMFEYSTNASGEIDKIETRGKGDNSWISLDSLQTLPSVLDTSNNALDAQYVFGVVYRKDDRQLQIGNLKTGEKGRHTIPNNSDINYYVIDLNRKTSSDTRVLYGDDAAFSDIGKTLFDDVNHVEKDSDYCVFIKYYKEDVQDVVIYKGYLENVMDFTVNY